jgi:hypothetical protein
LKVYPASKAKHWPFWTALRAAGVPICASWIDAPFNRDGSEPPDWGLHWQKCIDEAAAADVLLLFAQEDERQCSALVELGSALAAGKLVYLVSPHDWSFARHSRVRRFETLADAVAAIVAGSSLRAVGNRNLQIVAPIVAQKQLNQNTIREIVV